MPEETALPTYVLTLACIDRPGIVRAVADWLHDRGGNIIDSQQFDDRMGHSFFMRVHFEVDVDDLVGLRETFVPVASSLGMTWQMHPADAPYRALVMVSREGHCLNDLLFRQSTGSLNIVVPAVVSNHRDLERLAFTHDVPFVHLPVVEDRAAAEQRLAAVVDDLKIDVIVLARYMQVLSDDLCKRWEGRMINIHHSFLPSFKGARPYHQAYDRGVKLIGATAHYVTPDLDEGPIIEQDVTRVDHRATPKDMVRAGRDVEAQVLSRAVRWHAEQRLLLAGSRVVVFS